MRFLIKSFVFVGLILLVLVVAAWQMPASWIASVSDLRSKGYSYARMRGTLWQGEAEQVKYRDLMLGDIKWDFKTINRINPLTTTWAVDAGGIDYNVNLLIDMEGRQTTDIRLVQGRVPAGWVDLSDVAPLVFLTGTFDLDLDHVSPTRQLSNLATGTIYWNDAGLGGLVEESLGTVIVSLRSDNRFTYAQIQSDPDSELQIDGEVRINRTQYFSELTVKAEPEKQYVLEELAEMGTMNEDGSLAIELSGRIAR